MKICLITNLFKPYESWPKLYPETIAAELSKTNDVMVITPKQFTGLSSFKPSVETQDGIRIYRFFPLNVYYWSSPVKHHPMWLKIIWHLIDIWNPHPYFVIKAILNKEQPDVVHTMNLSGLSTSVFAAIKSSNCPHVHSLHDHALMSPWSNLLRNEKMIHFNVFDRQYRRIKRLFAGSVDAVLALSRFTRDNHLQNGYFKNCRSYLIDYPYRLCPERTQLKSYSPIHLLFVGNMVIDKGIYVLLESFKQLGRNNVYLHYAGRGPELDNLRLAAKDIDNVMIHGFVADNELTELYSQSNITIVPSLCFEAGKAAAFLESLPFGTPVVASTAGGGHEGIIDGVNGRLFEPGNSSMLRDILLDLINNRRELRAMEEGALLTANEYQLETCIDRLVTIYNEVKHVS